MKLINIPGFKALFGDPQMTYDRLLEAMPSSNIIQQLAAINSELYTPEEEGEKQRRLTEFIFSFFNDRQKAVFNQSFQQYRQLNPEWDGYFWLRPYLLTMLAKECSVNRPGKPEYAGGNFTYNFVLAYLLVVDEVNERAKIDDTIDVSDPLAAYKHLWPFLVDQYEYNQADNGPFGLFKLTAFSSHALKKLRPYLKEYLQQFYYPNLSHLLSGYYQLANSTLNYDTEQQLRKLTYLNPKPGVITSHLNSLTINSMLGKPTTIQEIKKFPVFKTSQGTYMVIDEAMLNRKIYNGPYFDLIKTTSLRNVQSYETYSTRISKDVLEDICFRSICAHLKKSAHDCLKFDNNEQSLPDCYYRNNKKTLFIEFKDYFFPERLVTDGKFEKIKEYIDQRFVNNEKGKPKGITQLLNNIERLAGGTYTFDKKGSDWISEGKKLTVYPILSFSDFMFTLPAVNQYLNEMLNSKLDRLQYPQLEIKPMTMISLETLFDLSYRGKDFILLTELIDQYHQLLREKKKLFTKNASTDIYLQSVMSFDEVYNSRFIKKYLGQINSRKVFSIADVVELSKEQMEETL